jgi:UDP-GlcNAc:undecaprenyl-phosphate GlcNAc-1-phosphate transferase
MEVYSLITFVLLFNCFIFFNFSKISKSLNFFDKPDGNLKKHKHPVSLLGGSLILVNIYLITFFFNLFDLHDQLFAGQFFYIFIILSTFFYIVGCIDDFTNLSPNLKLLLIAFSFLVTAYFFPEINLKLIKISFLDKNYYFNSFSTLFLLLSFSLLSNAMNMFDGINLQLILFTIFVFMIFVIKGFFSLFFTILLICLCFLGILNYKNKIFLGDSGSYLLSSIIGCTFIYQYNYFDNYLYGDEIFIILLIPSIDMLRLFVVRSLNKKNPFKGDLNHFHHIVNNYFRNKNLTVVFTILMCVMPSLLLIINVKTYYIFIISVIVYISIITYFKKKI